MKRNIVFVILLTFLFGCGPYIYFKTPQPKKKRNLEKIPLKITGKYMSVADSSIITIDLNTIVKKKFENTIMTLVEFKQETGDSLQNDTSFTFSDNWHIQLKIRNDSVFINSSKEEILFEISENQILRRYRKYYFLNYRDTNNLWKVELIKLAKDTLEYGNILTKEDVERIKGFTTVEEITDSINSNKSTKYYLNPAQKDLKKILKYRSKGEKYVKL